jgi:hypothetical protein
MIELPPPSSDDNKIEGYCRAEDVFAALKYYVNPQFLQRVLAAALVQDVGTLRLKTSRQLRDPIISPRILPSLHQPVSLALLVCLTPSTLPQISLLLQSDL